MQAATIQNDYLRLVVKTVRGLSPIPEFSEIETNRAALAARHFSTLRALYPNGESGSELLDMVLLMGHGFLELTWEKMSPSALTMCGEKSVDHLIAALEVIEAEGVAGDCIEAGVWRGGLTIVMRAFLKSVGNTQRKIWVADSFQGLPEGAADANDRGAQLLLAPLKHLAVTRRQVEAAFRFFELLDSQVEMLEGWFDESLKKISADCFSLIRLDGDYYESTRDALEALYDRLSPGGFLIVDDYGLPLGCKRAVDEFRASRLIKEPITPINAQAVFWRKSNEV